ncbi:hypothetical protein Q0F98_11755 [Paenibacillus amylolyticus]|nr:hypothetical protein Q0F98_11755 [Paenibacillus amylolyticus]
MKIRGFRIEVGEIEEQLLQINSVQETIVIKREGKSGQELCAYLVVSLPLTLGELRSAGAKIAELHDSGTFCSASADATHAERQNRS